MKDLQFAKLLAVQAHAIATVVQAIAAQPGIDGAALIATITKNLRQTATADAQSAQALERVARIIENTRLGTGQKAPAH